MSNQQKFGVMTGKIIIKPNLKKNKQLREDGTT